MTGAAAVAAVSGALSSITYLTETTDWAAACTTPPTTGRKDIVDGLIRSLQGAGVWSGLDWLLLCAAETQQAGLVNVRVPAKVATWTAGTGSFTADRGFTGDDTAAYISLGEALGDGGNFTLNSAARGIWCTQAGASGAGKYQMGVSSGRSFVVARDSAGNETFEINDGTASVFQGNPGTRSGHRSTGRTSSTSKKGFFNGVLVADMAITSTSLATNTAFLLRFSTNYGSDQVNAYWHGAGLDDAGHAAIDTYLRSYLTAVGAV